VRHLQECVKGAARHIESFAQRASELTQREGMVASVAARVATAEDAFARLGKENAALAAEAQEATHAARIAREDATSRHAVAEAAVAIADQSKEKAEARARDAETRATEQAAEAAERWERANEALVRARTETASVRAENERLFDAMEALGCAQTELQERHDATAAALKRKVIELDNMLDVRSGV
jgi:hypothetical protein